MSAYVKDNTYTIVLVNSSEKESFSTLVEIEGKVSEHDCIHIQRRRKMAAQEVQSFFKRVTFHYGSQAQCGDSYW